MNPSLVWSTSAMDSVERARKIVAEYGVLEDGGPAYRIVAWKQSSRDIIYGINPYFFKFVTEKREVVGGKTIWSWHSDNIQKSEFFLLVKSLYAKQELYEYQNNI